MTGYNKFYSDQAGSGIDVYSGYKRDLKGNGFFGRFYSNNIKPLMHSMGPTIKETAIDGVHQVVKKINKKIKTGKRKRRKHSNKRKSSAHKKKKLF